MPVAVKVEVGRRLSRRGAFNARMKLLTLDVGT